VYFGLSARLQLLDVAFFSLVLHRNEFTLCSVVIPNEKIFIGGNVYGGGVSVYMGGYSSSISFHGDALAAVSNTAVRNASVRVETASFTSCSANNALTGLGNVGNAYGGSFSLYLGGYAFSYSSSNSSASGLTTASGVSVSISNVNSSNCSATTAGNFGGNSYGGSMSVVYVGAYIYSFGSSGNSTSGLTTATGVSVSISNVNSSNCSATTTGGNSYGGSMSVVYVGDYIWSFCLTGNNSSSASATSGLTAASGVSVSISNVNSSNCSAIATGGNSYGGSMSAVYIGAYTWSVAGSLPSFSPPSSSFSGTTNVTGLVVSISSSTFANSAAVTGTFYSAVLFPFP
jgi:hypothetical protein